MHLPPIVFFEPWAIQRVLDGERDRNGVSLRDSPSRQRIPKPDIALIIQFHHLILRVRERGAFAPLVGYSAATFSREARFPFLGAGSSALGSSALGSSALDSSALDSSAFFAVSSNFAAGSFSMVA